MFDKKIIFKMLVMLLAILLLLIGVLPVQAQSISSPRQVTGVIWYVAPTGNDTNDCATPTTPCKTINGAINKAVDGDTIEVAIGTYTGAGSEVVLLSKSITLSGGWDASFAMHSGISIIDGSGIRMGLHVAGSNITAAVDAIRIQNGYVDTSSGGEGGGILVAANENLNLTNSVISGNVSQGRGGGIENYGTLTITNSTISGNTAGSGASGNYGGGGIENYGDLTLNTSTVSGNALSGGLLGSGVNIMGGTVILNNSTVSGNTGGSGDGIHVYSGTLTLNNSTISDNQTYGVFNVKGQVILQNTIIARSHTGKDCRGSMTSQGYNLIGNGSGCTWTAVTGDQVGTDASPVNPKLTPLQNHGGSTLTHALIAGSPALNAGNPATPGSGGNACLATDQLGVARPVNGVCDIGAYEGYVAGAPNQVLYVATTGSDANTCATPGTPCLTLRHAFSLTALGDIIKVAIGTYTAVPGAEVILLNKSVTLSGGWNAAFSAQSSLSTIDGQKVRRGITATGTSTILVDHFKIQNGLAQSAGGGILVDNLATLTLNNSIISNNVTQYSGGGGIENHGSLTINHITISGNINDRANYTDFQGGGGIKNYGSLTVNYATITGNSGNNGLTCGGIYTEGDATLNQLVVSQNKGIGVCNGNTTTTLAKGNLVINNSVIKGNLGSGVQNFNGAVTINTTTVSGNTGGGIRNSDSLVVNNSTISGNKGASGIATGGNVTINNSTISGNMGSSYGDGIYIQSYPSILTLNSSTVANNEGIGIRNAGAKVILQNTIVAGNGPNGDCYKELGLGGSMISRGYNLIGDGTNCRLFTTTGDKVGTSAKPIDPLLGPLQDNGGPTFTHALYFRSPAINAGNPATPGTGGKSCPAKDQRGTARLAGSICDIGAYEGVVMASAPLFPSFSVGDAAPTFKWIKLPGATQYQYQLLLGTTVVYSHSVAASACGATTCSDAKITTLQNGNYKWQIRTLVNGVWGNFGSYRTFTLYVPRAGYWSGPPAPEIPAVDEFYVIAPHQNQLKNFAVYIRVIGCGIYKIAHSNLVPIKGEDFMFSGSFSAEGSFHKNFKGTYVNGTFKLTSYPINCGGLPKFISGGPFPWEAHWRNYNQPTAGETGGEGDISTIMDIPDLGTSDGIITIQPTER